jgi:hypothetical protein
MHVSNVFALAYLIISSIYMYGKVISVLKTFLHDNTWAINYGKQLELPAVIKAFRTTHREKKKAESGNRVPGGFRPGSVLFFTGFRCLEFSQTKILWGVRVL